MMRLEISEAAAADLVDIYAYGAVRYGLAQADDYMAGLRRLFESLLGSPFMGRERNEIRPPIRLMPCGAHHVFYDVIGDRLIIQRVLHHMADWTAGL